MPPTRHPRVGLAVFLVDDRGYVLIGKRKGAHGSGTLALPGGHLEWNESFEECATRELLEETGVEIKSTSDDEEVGMAAGGGAPEGQGLKFLTALNCRGITSGQGTSPDGLHYVTVFMRARVHRKPGEQEVPVKVSRGRCDAVLRRSYGKVSSTHRPSIAFLCAAHGAR
jgi:8-oxo-dGTP pyrophosphatase MutT (NUDIX family)